MTDIQRISRKKNVPWRSLASWTGLFVLVFTFLGLGLISTHGVTAEPKSLEAKDVPLSFGSSDTLGIASTSDALTLRKTSDIAYETTRTIESEGTKAAFPFNGLALSWHATSPQDTSVSWEYQTYNGFYWSDWQPLEVSEDLYDPSTQTAYTDMAFMEPAKSYRFRLTLATANTSVTPRVTDPIVHYLDSRAGNEISTGMLSATAVAEPKIISRAEWGADESLMTWPPEYATPKKFVIHHTAGGFGGSNPASVVRGIYHYHAVTRGWGDIGYNYVVDENGNIFEGRKGGNGVIGAHAQGYNDGTIGISVMGDYTKDAVTSKTKNSLINLIAAKAAINNIVPDATSTLKDKTNPNVVGHRDMGQTECPGDNLYSQIPEIRTKASDIISEGETASDFSAQITEKPTTTIMEDHSVKKITVKMKNVGEAAWTNNSDYPLTLVPASSPSSWHDTSWLASDRVVKLQESRVTPGATGTFVFTIRDSLGEGSRTESFKVRAGNLTTVTGSTFTLNIQVLARYKAEVHSFDTNVILAPGDKKAVKIRLKNLGTRTWTNTGSNYTFLQVDKPLKRLSKFYDEPSWVAGNTQPTRVDSANVPPGYVGTFEFLVIAPDQTGNFTEDFSAGIEDVIGKLPGSDVAMKFAVKAPYSATVVEKPTVITSETNKSQTVTVKMKNTGARVWKNTGDNLVLLRVHTADGKKSALAHTTWTDNNQIPGQLLTPSVANGEVGTFTFFIQVPKKAGTYEENFSAATSEQASLSGSSFELSVMAEPPYAGEVVSRSHETFIMEDDRDKMFTLSLRNTGTRTWGPGSTYIATDSPTRRTSIFQHESWGPYDYIASKLTTTVDPGETGTFQIWFHSPSGRRTTTEAFYAGIAGGTRIEGTEFTVPIQVLPRYEATVLSTNPSSVSMSPKEIRQVSFNIRNTGTRSWSADGTNAVGLYVTEPTNRTSPFYDPSWSSTSRPTRIDEPSVVAPGEYGSFRFLLNAPGVSEGFTEHYKLMADNIQWITGSDLTVSINVKYQKPQALLKIGVFKSSTIQVTGNGSFKATNANTGATHKQFASGNVVSVTYESGQYHTTGPGLDVRTSSPVKFIPVDSTILEIKNMSDRPSWDTSLNDNRFRGNIIVQRSDATGETWAINQIYMEHYLRGIAEQSNTTHATHLRTMAVIERTYAQYNFELGGKHPELNFDLNNTSGDQVYKGYGFEIRSPNVTTAVDATRGQMVTVGGDIVVTPYFSQSDGRTRSWSEVWSGSQSHCISVPDPWSEGRPLVGHGVGLAAYGALKQAEEGKDYKTILKYYYTGIAITDFY